MKSAICATLMVALLAAGCSQSESQPDASPQATSEEPNLTPVIPEREVETDVVYVPTPQPVVDAMLKLAEVGEGDVLYDLGSGDGRIPIAAAKQYGIRAVGVDIDPQRIAEARKNARNAGVEDLVTFRQADLFETDFSEASVVTLYLLTNLNEKLKPKLLSDLEPGSRVVSHSFDMGDWKPEKQEHIAGRSIFLWTIP